MLERLSWHRDVTFLRAAFSRRHDIALERVGGDYGSWTVPTGIDETWNCLTVGVGEEAALDIALADRGCRVVAVDPTPRAVEYIEPLVESRPTLTFVPVALWTEDTELEFFPPANPEHVSFSATDRQGVSAEPLIVPARSLETLCSDAGFATLDFLKLDIEGAEYPVLESIDLKAAGVRVLCVEFHNDHGLRAMYRAIRRVERQGYNVVNVRNTDVTFVAR